MRKKVFAFLIGLFLISGYVQAEEVVVSPELKKLIQEQNELRKKADAVQKEVERLTFIRDNPREAVKKLIEPLEKVGELAEVVTPKDESDVKGAILQKNTGDLANIAKEQGSKLGAGVSGAMKGAGAVDIGFQAGIGVASILLLKKYNELQEQYRKDQGAIRSGEIEKLENQAAQFEDQANKKLEEAIAKKIEDDAKYAEVKAKEEKAVREKAAREKAAREKAAREKAAREKAAREKAAKEKAVRKAAEERLKSWKKDRYHGTGNLEDQRDMIPDKDFTIDDFNSIGSEY
ncbi:MAG: hypothetical protein JEZ12_11825 [Desulfobacterium sp.]|nr:hypothetical protein [Desulfobacterium sp.]